ncbi:SIS domain-containing protein [Erysipelothrix sp. HDW6C]|uniref:D-sedoheptulose-7-phosphate isomerase n=1 Tax=Erysipelothrix sp. HDW6C TaxID=2714930 RepID=UPI00140A2F17|nr:SIS domain-containing protein [Erysipelothrix sp. HDW6C]QIK70650.1 SIS domain-containing protein [Erysipelothrix sp. HDW6C]
MKSNTEFIINRFYDDNPKLKPLTSELNELARTLTERIQNGAKVLLCGNGGSAADSDHIVGELMKGFDKLRPLPEDFKEKYRTMYGDSGYDVAQKLQQGIPAISLNQHNALNSATLNDIDPNLIFAQQIMGLGNQGDILIGISTSGQAENVAQAIKAANVKGLHTIGLTGKTGGQLVTLSDMCIVVPANETYRVQEFHLAIYHFLCLYIESEMFDA